MTKNFIGVRGYLQQKPGYTQRMRCLGRLIMFAVLFGAAAYGAVTLLDPWALHIGGRSTPLLGWGGVGTLKAKDGKTYPLYVYFHPSPYSSRLHKNGLRPVSGYSGTGELCTGGGAKQSLKLIGTQWGGYSNTDGSLVSLRLLEFKVIDTANQKGYFDLAGSWHGDQLVLMDPGQVGRAFLNGTALIEGATVTLNGADREEFDAACGASGSRK